MITALRLLQTKYSLSDEFIANAIRAEIERQALLDIKGVISNASPLALETAAKIIVEPRTTLDDIVGKSDSLVAAPNIDAEKLIVDKDKFVEETRKIVDSAVDKITGRNKGNRRGR